ncbi:MAG: hypothetical protein ACKOAV_12490 [Bacteroidota bacterium]
MGYSKNFQGLCDLPEVREIIKVFIPRNYTLDCDDRGLYLDKFPTEVRLIPETDRLRLVIHDDGQDVSETYKALRIVEATLNRFGLNKKSNPLALFFQTGLVYHIRTCFHGIQGF